MKQIRFNPAHKHLFSEDFITGFNEGAKRQFEADARPKGKWTTRRTEYHDGEWWCTNCEQRCLETVMGKPRWKYCPYCGAEMETDNE